MRARGELSARADPGRLALALQTALQGCLLLTRICRDTLELCSAVGRTRRTGDARAPLRNSDTRLPKGPAPTLQGPGKKAAGRRHSA